MSSLDVLVTTLLDREMELGSIDGARTIARASNIAGASTTDKASRHVWSYIVKVVELRWDAKPSCAGLM